MTEPTDKCRISDSSDLTKRRSPSELCAYVEKFKKAVAADKAERHPALLKKGNYKEFLDEIVPLSAFAKLFYPETFRIEPVFGNQGYDVLVFDDKGNEVDRVEITVPQDGATSAKEAKSLVANGFGPITIGTPGDDFDAKVEYVLATCRKKAQKDYSDCTLVVTIWVMPPFPGFEDQYERQVATMVKLMSEIQFIAKRVFLLILPDRLEVVRQ